MDLLHPPTVKRALTIANQLTSTWRTKSGTPLAVTTQLTQLSALSSALFHLTGTRLTTQPEYIGILRTLNKRKALHIRKQALPMTVQDLRRIASAPHLALEVRQVTVLAFSLGLRHADTQVLQWRDLHYDQQSKTLRLRFRGLKNSEIGSRVHWRFLHCTGPASLLRQVGIQSATHPPEEYVFRAVSRARLIRALRWTNPNYTAHSLRRGCATHLSNQGVPMSQISDHLGHKDIATTRLYIEPAPGQLESRQTIRLARLATSLPPSHH
jgi:integrase